MSDKTSQSNIELEDAVPAPPHATGERKTRRSVVRKNKVSFMTQHQNDRCAGNDNCGQCQVDEIAMQEAIAHNKSQSCHVVSQPRHSNVLYARRGKDHVNTRVRQGQEKAATARKMRWNSGGKRIPGSTGARIDGRTEQKSPEQN